MNCIIYAKNIKSRDTKMAQNQRLFPSDYANECVKNIMDPGPCRGVPISYANWELHKVSVDPKLMEHLAEHNGFGQTLAYVLLRFAAKSDEREVLLRFMSMKALMLRNTRCGSTALMGFFWGEKQNPRFTSLSNYLVDGKHVELTPAANVLSMLVQKGLTLSILTSQNDGAETALEYIIDIVKVTPKDRAAVNTILGNLE